MHGIQEQILAVLTMLNFVKIIILKFCCYLWDFIPPLNSRISHCIYSFAEKTQLYVTPSTYLPVFNRLVRNATHITEVTKLCSDKTEKLGEQFLKSPFENRAELESNNSFWSRP